MCFTFCFEHKHEAKHEYQEDIDPIKYNDFRRKKKDIIQSRKTHERKVKILETLSKSR